MTKINITIYISIFFIFNSMINSQSKTNLEVVEGLISKSIYEISKNSEGFESTEMVLDFSSSEDYKILKNFVISNLQKKDIKLVGKSEVKNNILNYNLIEIKTDYPEMFRDGLFGEYLVKRNVSLSGSYFLTSENGVGKVNNFNYVLKDTVIYDDLNKLDNIAYSFTSAEIPEEPFFSSTLEPIIAVSTAAVAVYLFFNVRSK